MILTQKSILGMFSMNILQNKHNAAIGLQQIWRGYATNKYFTQTRIASIEIQRVWRWTYQVSKYKSMIPSAVTIQSKWRCHATRKSYTIMLYDIIRI